MNKLPSPDSAALREKHRAPEVREDVAEPSASSRLARRGSRLAEINLHDVRHRRRNAKIDWERAE